MNIRARTVILLLCGWLAHRDGWIELPERWRLGRDLAPEERAAVELQCRGMDGVLRESCEQETSHSLIAGDFDPEPILRVHCTRFDNDWATDVEIPPSLCIERYGGWLHG